MNLLNSDHFWQFACTLYAKPGQQQTLLALQNQQGKNINLCLLLLYLDSLNLAINTEQLSILEHSISEFEQHALHPLRATRRYLKTNKNSIRDYNQIRESLLNAELMLEKQQQNMLINAVNKLTLSQNKTANNYQLYC